MLPRPPTVETRATEIRFLSRCPGRHLVRAGLAIAAATLFSDRAAEEQRSTVHTVAAELRIKYEIIRKKYGTTSTYERARVHSTAVTNILGYSPRNGKFKRLEPYFQISNDEGMEGYGNCCRFATLTGVH